MAGLPFIDTDVIIRFLTGDDPAKQDTAAKLFEQIGTSTLKVTAPVTVIADAVYVLSSPRLYNLPPHEVASLLIPLVRLPSFRVKERRIVLAALSLYGSATPQLDFGDAIIVASMQQGGSETLYSFDKDFDHISGITRQEP
jgi:predicted nucleic acid-binding protein